MMTTAYNTYQDNIDSASQLHRIAFEQKAMGMEYEVSELYRSELILIVSAFDTYFHDIIAEILTNRLLKGRTWKKKMKCRYGIRPHLAKSIIKETDFNNRKKRIREHLLDNLHKYTFQSSYSISKGFKRCKINDIWKQISEYLELDSEDTIKKKLDEIIKERNLIVHQAHLDPITGEKLQMTEKCVEDAKDVLLNIVNSIDEIAQNSYL